MSKQHYDFAGWATRCDIKCSDGRTIRRGAFSGDNGKRVPLVWMHNHGDINQVLGHADLEERDGDIYAYCSFNATEAGQNAKECVNHGDVVALSIYANQLKQKGGDVLHGAIKEVSVVLAGANRGAVIDSILSHGEISEEEAIISFVGYGDVLLHAQRDEDDDEENEENEEENTSEEDEEENTSASGDDEEDEENEDDENEDGKKKEKKPIKHADEEENKEDDETIGDVLNTLSEKQKKAVAIMIHQITSGKKELSHADAQNVTTEDGETIEDVLNTLNEKQKKVVDYLVGTALEHKEGGTEMAKHNTFEGAKPQNTLSHDDFVQIMSVGRQMGSLREAFRQAADEDFIQHDDGDYGITNLEYLFPEAKTINNTPEFIKRNTDWVEGVISACHKTPFSRVKTIFADITEDAARAKGYLKGKYKKEEVFALLKRTTSPQTIYKKQKLDKQDIDDVTENMNIVPWMKSEMQLMLREEIARSILIGDGRLADDDDKIHEENIRPVYNDEDLFTVKIPVSVAANATDDEVAKALIKAQIKARKQYKGSGSPKFYTTDDYITDGILLENSIGERLYKSEAELATAMRVKEIVPVEAMEGKTIEINENGVKKTYPLIGVTVNLADYNIGTNGGAKTDFFDDFDLNFNQMIYLYETRMSGALVKPHSAISFYLVRE